MSIVLTMGCDPHLDSITTAVVDPVGAEIETVTVPNNAHGWDDTVDRCHRFGITRVGIEGASGYGRCLAQTLTRAGIEVVEIPTRVTARTRRVDGAGKTDPGDARTIARATTAGAGHTWVDHTVLETIRVLSSRRDHLVKTQTADINQLRALLREIDPARAATLGRLRSASSFAALTTNEYHDTLHEETVGDLIAQIAADCQQRRHHITQLETRLAHVMPPAGEALITEYQGCDTITAAHILAHLAGTDGFATDAKMASWAGTAPLDVSSGRQQHHRLNRGGNRQINRALHTIILTQYRHGGDAATYIQRRTTTENTTTKAAIRAAMRHLTRRIWKTLHQHQLT